MSVVLSNISRAPVGVPGKADEVIRQASVCTFVCFHTRYFLLRPPVKDTHAYDMIGRIIAMYIHFIIDGFIPKRTQDFEKGGQETQKIWEEQSSELIVFHAFTSI